jgi:hypothetical protein
MKEPTQEIIRELWEWCGWKVRPNLPSIIYGNDATWVSPEKGKYSREIFSETLPPIDLNNLFKWAVPALIKKIGKHRAYLLLSGCLSDSILLGKKLEDEIFLIICKVIKEEKMK